MVLARLNPWDQVFPVVSFECSPLNALARLDEQGHGFVVAVNIAMQASMSVIDGRLVLEVTP